MVEVASKGRATVRRFGVKRSGRSGIVAVTDPAELAKVRAMVERYERLARSLYPIDPEKVMGQDEAGLWDELGDATDALGFYIRDTPGDGAILVDGRLIVLVDHDPRWDYVQVEDWQIRIIDDVRAIGPVTA